MDATDKTASTAVKAGKKALPTLAISTLMLMTLFTVWKVDEYNPATYAKYHGIAENHAQN